MIDDQELAGTILSLATARGDGKTICPSEVARQLWPDEWRQHMQDVRDASIKLRNEERVIITQGGKEIFDDVLVGPIRIQISKLDS